jgi:putative ABC transport system permease protein
MSSAFDGPARLLLGGELRAHGARFLVGAMAIAIGVAMGYAVHLINHAALAEFSAAVSTAMGNADLEIRGPRAGFDESLYPRIARLPQVADISPALEVDAVLVDAGATEPLKILGLDVFRAAAVQPNLVGRLPEGADPLGQFAPDALFLSPAAQAWLGLKPGDFLTVQAGIQPLRLRIAGTLPVAGEGVRLGVMDIAAAQASFRSLGVLHRLAVRLRPGVSPGVFKEIAGGLLPAGVSLTAPETQTRRSANLSRAYRVNLNVLALVALFTGAFLVFTTQTLAALRRRSQLGLLRVLRVTRAGILRLVWAEGLMQGLLGALLGLALGYGTAAVFLAQFGGDLGGGYFGGERPALRFEPAPALVFLALGMASALAGSLAPAWEAARASPARALRAGDEESPLKPLRAIWPGLLLLLLGGALTLHGPVGGLPLYGYLAIACLLLGGILLMPWLAWRLFTALPRGWRPATHLALAQLAAAPGRAAIALGGILTSFTLMVAMAIMVSSFRDSVDRWLDLVLPADLYLRAAPGGDSGYIPAEAQRAILVTPGVARAEFQRITQIELDPTRPPVTLIARAIDPADPGARLALVGAPLAPGRDDPVRIWARQHGALVMNQADYRRLTGDARVSDAAVWLASGTGLDEATARLRAAIPGGERLQYATPGEIRARSLGIFDRSFAVTYLLEGVAMVIGLIGIGASFSGQALARAAEFGMLRHVGMTRRQIGGLLALEGALLTGLGCLAGLALGLAIALILVYVVNPQSFHWRMELAMPWGLLTTVALTLVASAALTSLASGWRAMSPGAVRAVREDW